MISGELTTNAISTSVLNGQPKIKYVDNLIVSFFIISFSEIFNNLYNLNVDDFGFSFNLFIIIDLSESILVFVLGLKSFGIVKSGKTSTEKSAIFADNKDAIDVILK
jgi:hypothetical protein